MQGSTRRRLAASSATLAALVAVGWGCGGSGGRPPVSGSMTEATVSGKVLVNGLPAKGGIVKFNPSNIKRKMVPVRTTDVNADGTYEITTLIGENTISFGGPELSAFAFQTDYFDVQQGTNTYDINLPLPDPVAAD